MLEGHLNGKKIIITGASGGLGFAMAKALGLHGASVLITSPTPHKLAKALADLTDLLIDAFALDMDVRSEASILDAVAWVEENWGALDMLVNNAGIGMRTVNPRFLSDPMPFFEVSAAGFRNVIDTNLTGYFLVAKAFVPFFIRQNRGKIVNISVSHETMSRKGFIPYGPSRAATESLSAIMAQDLLGFNVAVNLLLPGGATDTGMVPDEFKQTKPAAFTLLSPDIIADPIVFLAGDESNTITGERIIATGFKEWKQRMNIG